MNTDDALACQKFIAGSLALSLSAVVCTASAAFMHPSYDGDHATLAYETHANTHTHVSGTDEIKNLIAEESHCTECFKNSVTLPLIQKIITLKRVATLPILSVQAVAFDQRFSLSRLAFRSREGPLFGDAILLAKTLILRT